MRNCLYQTLLFILFFCPTLLSNSNYNFRQITISEGLTQSTVNSLLLDSKGSLWIGTKSGLNRFTQHELTTFLHDEDDKYSLPDNLIQFVGEDLEHNIWVSTRKGLVLYDQFKKEFNPIIRGTVFSYLPQKDGVLFGGEEMLYKYSYQNKNIVRIPFPAKKGSIPMNYNIVKLIKLDKNRVLVGTKNMGVYIYNIEKNAFQHLIVTNQQMLLSLYLGSDGLIYISTFGQGVSSYDKKGTLVNQYLTSNSSLKNNIVLDIVEKDHKLWMATDGSGINVLDLKTKQFSDMKHIPGEKNSLPVNSITTLYKDANDNLWAGSVRGGAFSIKETFIKTYSDAPLNNTSGLSEKAVISMYKDYNKGLLWLGTDGGGINSYNPITEKFTHYISTYGDKVTSIAGLSDSELLISVFGKGMFVFNKNSQQLTPFTIVDKQTTQNEFFTGFMPLGHNVADNKIYILSQSPWVYHIKEKTFSKIKIQDKNLSTDGLILAYSNDSVSFAMRENQVFQINQKNDDLQLLVSLGPKELISSISYDEEKYLWIASNNGLTRYDPSTKEIKHIETKLFHNISHLFLDKNKRLWISAQNMLFSYFIDEDKFVVWSEIDGFAPNEILFMYQAQLKFDNIYIAGTEGLVRIDQKIIYDEIAEPEIQLNDISFNGSSYMSHVENQSIDIPWNYTSLSISTSLNERDIFRKTMYKFIIRGAQEQTIESYSPSISLPSLSPGKYSILVSHNTRDGSYTEAIKIVDIVVVPPWYRSPWFILTSILTLALLVILAVRFIIWRNKDALKWEMKEYEQHLNEEKINFLVNISHELRTPLTLIYAPLKRLIDQSKDSASNAYNNQLLLIYKQARQMKDIINMVLDINRLNATEDNIRKQRCQLNSWVKTITEEFDNEWNDNNISIQYKLDEQIGDVYLDEWKCQIVFSNFLMNALKFSEPNTQITISTRLINEKVRIEVSDQGIGLQDEDINKLFDRFSQGKHNKLGTGIGLAYAKALIEKHGGNIGAYNNNDNIGATFYFEIPATLQNNSTISSKETISLQANNQASTALDFSYSEFSVLIVEDEQDLRNFLEDIFKDQFKNVYTAENGAQALRTCKTKQPDIVISDVMMPEMDGYEFCRQLKLDLEISHIPVILLTARTDEDSVKTGYKQGADFYITKPFEQDHLFTITSNLLRSRKAIHERYKKGSTPILPIESTISKGDEDFITRMNLIIDENISDPEFTIDQLVANMHMSRASLYNKVKAITDLGVNDYINRIKIEKASNLLKNTTLSIKEISFEVGFTYSRYFSTIFKELTGMTPTQFRDKK